jgi:hypothetical protein
MQQMFVARCWAAGSGPVGCLDGDDVGRDATMEKIKYINIYNNFHHLYNLQTFIYYTS